MAAAATATTAAAAAAAAAAACSSDVSVSEVNNAFPSAISAISIAADSDSDSEDLRLLLPNLVPASAAAAPSSEAQLHQFHLPALPSPITIRTIPSLGLTFQLWPSATTLLHFLPASPHLLPTAHCPLSILELGSGTGAAGLALAAALPAHTVLSDLPAALPNLRHNASLNASLFDSRGGSVSVVPLPWGDAAAMEAVVAPAPASRFDLVVASDVVYYEALVDPLIETLRFFVKGEVVFLMAHMRRWKRTDKKFFGKARKVFDIEVLHKDPPPEGWRHGPVVYRFTVKKKRDKK